MPCQRSPPCSARERPPLQLSMTASDGPGHVNINVGTDIAKLRTNAQNILASIRDARPKSTNLAYEPKKKEFQVRWRVKYR
jgi:hypothetical protein